MMKYIKNILVLIIFGLITGCNAQTDNNKSLNSNYKFTEIDSLIIHSIKDEAFPGAVVLVGKDGKIIYEKGFGCFTYDSNSTKVTPITIYDIASLTKVIAATTAAMICIDRNLFKLSDVVAKYIPEFKVNNKQDITIKNLLLHNSGLSAWIKYYNTEITSDEILQDIYKANLEYTPGTKTVYSDLGMIVLGKVIEAVTGKRLDEFCEEEIFLLLEMNSTFFNPPDSLKYRIAPTEDDKYWRLRLIQGEVHDETASLLGGVTGHAGLFSTCEDIATLLQMLLDKGQFNGRQFIQDKTVNLFTKNLDDKSSRALGWDTRSDSGSSSGKYFSDSSFGHTGFTGTSVWIDPTRNLFVVFLTNRVYPSRDNKKIIEVRPKLHDAVIEAIE